MEINENRIILSDPRIQPFNEFEYTSKDDILYFYYDLELQCKASFFSILPVAQEENERKEKKHKKHKKAIPPKRKSPASRANG